MNTTINRKSANDRAIQACPEYTEYRTKPQKRLCYISNTLWFFVSHRMHIAKAAQESGYEVHIIAPHDMAAQQELVGSGLIYHPVELPRQTLASPKDVLAILNLYRILFNLSPLLIHAVTAKPILLAAIFSNYTGNPTVLAFTGMRFLKHLNQRSKLAAMAAKYLLRQVCNGGNKIVIVQNTSDRSWLCRELKLPKAECILIPGSGVCMNAHPPTQRQVGPKKTIIYAGRMVEDKGVRQLVRAVEILNERGRPYRLMLVGKPDHTAPDPIDAASLSQWAAYEWIDYLGHRNDVPELLRQSDLACLPSLGGEGVPKFLLEAGASGLPIVVTDVAGCNDVVIDGVHGLIVKPDDIAGLTDAIDYILTHPKLAERMGQQSRMQIELNLTTEHVATSHLNIYEKLIRTTETKPRAVTRMLKESRRRSQSTPRGIYHNTKR